MMKPYSVPVYITLTKTYQVYAKNKQDAIAQVEAGLGEFGPDLDDYEEVQEEREIAEPIKN